MNDRVRWAAILAVASTTLIVLAMAAGALLPTESTHVRQTTITRPPEAVWAVITDFGRTADWCPLFDSSVVIEEGKRWRARFHDEKLDVVFEVVEAAPPARIVQRIANPDQLPFSGTLTIGIEPASGGSRVTIRADSTVPNPFRRLLTRLALGPDYTLGQLTSALRRRLGSN